MSLKRKSISLILSFILIILAICPNAYAQDIHSDETISVVNFSNKSIPIDLFEIFTFYVLNTHLKIWNIIIRAT